MARTVSGPDAELRLVAARFTLGLANSWDIPPIADRALTNGIYSDALAELAALTSPTYSDVAPLLTRAFRELGLAVLSRADAAQLLARDCMEQLASSEARPRDILELVVNISQAAKDVLPDRTYVGEGLDVGMLIGNYWSYTEPNENYYEAEKRLITDEGERQAILDSFARREAKAWLDRHKQ